MALEPTLAPAGDIGLDPPVFPLRQVTLPSGLRVGFERAPTRGTVGVVLVVGSGSTSDPAGKEGLAHLVEHLSFHARFEEHRVGETLARLGATYNADTDLDRTRFYEFAPRSALPVLLRLAAQRLAQPLAGVEPDEVAVERDIVENEIRQRSENGVYGQVSAWIQTALFPPDHPYVRPTGGSHESVRRLTLEDARRYVASAYAPRNASLLIVGDFDEAAAAATVQQFFPPGLLGDAARPERPVLQPPQAPPAYLPPAPPTGAAVTKAAVVWPEIWLTYYLADMYGPYAPAMKVLTAPVVAKNLRKILIKDDDVTDVQFAISEFRQATVVACRISLLSDHRRVAIADRARRLIAALWARGGPGALGVEDQVPLLGETQQLALANAILETEPFVARATTRAEYFHMTGSLEAYDRLIQAVAGVRSENLIQHGSYLFAPERARVLYVEPLPETERPPPGIVGVPSVDTRKMTDAPVEGIDFGDPPPAEPVAELRGARVKTLPNGLRLVLVRRPQFPAIAAVLGFRGGTGAAPTGTIELLRRLEREGLFSLKRNALEIRKVDDEDYSADLVLGGRRNLSNALLLLAGRLRALDQISWARVLHRLRATNPPVKESPATRATREFWRALYGEHPYARVLGTDALRAVQAAEMEAWVPRLYNPRNATLVIAGDFEPAWAESLAGNWFGTWQATEGTDLLEVPRVPPPPSGAPNERVLVTHRPASTQVELVLGCRLPSNNDPQSLATARMLAGLVESNLSTRLRKEAGAAYAVSGDGRTLRGGGAHLLVRTSIDNLRFREALRVVRGLWEHFGRGEFDRGSLSQVRWGLVRGESLSFQTAAETAVEVFEAENHDWS
ncbi:MAG TPA: insulinase family protein, partial [Polyangia bacterium]|nr:insulinase family protein [Polyangia bacterium]